jgi:hypothetical protein
MNSRDFNNLFKSLKCTVYGHSYTHFTIVSGARYFNLYKSFKEHSDYVSISFPMERHFVDIKTISCLRKVFKLYDIS